MRLNLVGTIIGQRGSGKTDFLKGNQKHKLPGVLSIYPGKGMKVLIIDTLDHPSYRDITILKQKDFKNFKSGIVRTFLEPDHIKKLVNVINMSPHMNNTLIVFEDATKYTESKLPRAFKRIIADSKQRNIDIIFMYHSWGQTPLDLLRNLDYIQLFKTEDSPECRKKNISQYDKVLLHYTRVKESKFQFETSFIDTRSY